MNRWLLTSFGVFTLLSSAHAVQQAITIVPATDVWKSPAASSATLTDDDRQTQLLAGEAVDVIESSGDWVRIEIPDQPAFRANQRWQGYPGWVRGSALAVLSAPKGTRAAILDVARAYLGSPYLWGGMTPAGADCSGLVHLAYRFNGIQIPRDSYEQWMKAKPISRRELKPADLILSAKTSDPKKISHVALYAGGDRILEAPQNGIAVRDIPFKDKYGQDLSKVESGETVGDHVIFFGRFLKK
jgi:cell wall-associated NlpC family hydrolase